MAKEVRIDIEKLLVSIVLVLTFVFLPKYGYLGYGDIWNHLLYPFSHANIFHLLANILCFWMIRCKTYLLLCFIVSFLCSFLPSLSCEPTMGFSGILFAIVGMSWGRSGRFLEMLKRNMWFLIIPMFIPHVNGLLHVYCMLAGYILGIFYGERG